MSSISNLYDRMVEIDSSLSQIKIIEGFEPQSYLFTYKLTTLAKFYRIGCSYGLNQNEKLSDDKQIELRDTIMRNKETLIHLLSGK